MVVGGGCLNVDMVFRPKLNKWIQDDLTNEDDLKFEDFLTNGDKLKMKTTSKTKKNHKDSGH